MTLMRNFPIFLLLLFFLAGIINASENLQESKIPEYLKISAQDNPLASAKTPAVKALSSNYNANIKVYIAEPRSRWWDYEYNNYENGFLGLAIDKSISIPYEGTHTDTVIWNGTSSGYGDITDSNIMALAAVFEDVGHTAYSEPPSSGQFTAYYVDATTIAKPGEPGSDTLSGTIDHNVFVESASANF